MDWAEIGVVGNHWKNWSFSVVNHVSFILVPLMTHLSETNCLVCLEDKRLVQQWFDKSKHLWQHLCGLTGASVVWTPDFLVPDVITEILLFHHLFQTDSSLPWRCEFPRPCQCRKPGCCGGAMWSSRAEKHLGREGMVLQHLGPNTPWLGPKMNRSNPSLGSVGFLRGYLVLR